MRNHSLEDVSFYPSFISNSTLCNFLDFVFENTVALEKDNIFFLCLDVLQISLGLKVELNKSE